MENFFEVRNLKKYFPVYRGIFRRQSGYVKAVDGISFSMKEGEVVGLVGESGSGKSTAGQTAIRLTKPTHGTTFFLGRDLSEISSFDLRKMRQKVQMIFQDPLASLNPRKTILENVGEPLLFHKLVRSYEEMKESVCEILQKVGLSSAVLNQYPHQFSGGQQQRISIGRALILQPKLLICDEITSALDLSVQAQVLNLLNSLKKAFKLSYLLISHDLAVVQYLCDRVLVMYEGKIIEEEKSAELFCNPQHPYTIKLLESRLITHPRERQIN